MPIVNPIADWRLLIKGMGGSGAHGGKNWLTFNAPTDLWTRTATGIISYDYDIANLQGAGTGGPYWVNPVIVPYDPVHQTGGSFWELKEGPHPGYLVSAWSNTLGYGNITVTQDANFNRGPGATLAEFHHPNAHLAGASTNYNAPGELHFTLLVDDPQIHIPIPKQTHYAIEFEVLLTTPFGAASTDTLTSANHGLVAGDTITFKSLTGGAGLTADGATVYYVIASGLTANNFKVSTTAGGAAVNFTTDITAGSFWREVFAGYIWDFDQTDTECVFYGIDYLGALQYSYDERFITNSSGVYQPETSEPTGSKYVNQTISQIVTKQLDYHIAKSNSIVGFIARGSIATMSEEISGIYSTMQQGLAFIKGLLDSHRAGTGKETRLSVKKLSGVYTFVVEDDPGSKKDDLALAYGTLVQGYRVIPFGTNWASRSNMFARDRMGQNLMYDSNSSAVSQEVFGSIGAPPVMIESIDRNDMKRRNLQLAIDQSRFGRQISVGLKLGSYRPFEAFDIADMVPVAIAHGAVDTAAWGSDAFQTADSASDHSGILASYWAILGVTWESFDDGHWMTGLSLYPKGGGRVLPVGETVFVAIFANDGLVGNNISPSTGWTKDLEYSKYDPTQYGGPGGTAVYSLWTKVNSSTATDIGSFVGVAGWTVWVYEVTGVDVAGIQFWHTEDTMLAGTEYTFGPLTSTVPALLIGGASIQVTGYSTPQAFTPSAGTTELVDVDRTGNLGDQSTPWVWRGYATGTGALSVKCTPVANPNLNKFPRAAYAILLPGIDGNTPVIRQVGISGAGFANYPNDVIFGMAPSVGAPSLSGPSLITPRVDLVVGNGAPPAGSNPNNATTYLDRTTGQLYTWSDDTQTWSATGSPGPTIKSWPLADVLAAGNSANSLRIINLLDPSSAQDAATKAYVDTQVATSGGSMTPYYIAPGDTFTVPINKQATYAMTIDNEGILIVDGYLLEVD